VPTISRRQLGPENPIFLLERDGRQWYNHRCYNLVLKSIHEISGEKTLDPCRGRWRDKVQFGAFLGKGGTLTPVFQAALCQQGVRAIRTHRQGISAQAADHLGKESIVAAGLRNCWSGDQWAP